MRPRAFTLVEVLMALVLTGLIGATVASMIYGVTHSTSGVEITARRNSQNDVACARLNSQIRSAGQILGIGSGVVVLWIADTRVNQKPNLSELLRIEYDSSSGEIRAYAAPSTLLPSDDTTYDLTTTDFLATTAALKGTANFPYTTIVLHCGGWVISPSTFTSTTRFISYTLTLNDETNVPFSARSTVAMRAQINTGS